MMLRTARIFVRDLPGASRFYEEILGLPLKAEGSEQGFCVFDAGPMSLVVELQLVQQPLRSSNEPHHHRL